MAGVNNIQRIYNVVSQTLSEFSKHLIHVDRHTGARACVSVVTVCTLLHLALAYYNRMIRYKLLQVATSFNKRKWF